MYFTRNMDGNFFVEILKWHLLDQARAFHENSWFLIQDNDPKHTSRVAKTWMHRNMEKQMFDWPSQSPDLNPIENLFAWLKQRLGRKRFRTLEELKSEVIVLWESITPDMLKPYYKPMKHRCEAVSE